MKVLSFSTMFPNAQQPSHGLFVRERVRALSKLMEVRVVAPVPWFPPVRMLGERYYRYSQVQAKEHDGDLCIDHPRFPVIPRFLKATDSMLLAAGVASSLARIRKEFPFDVIDSHWAYPDGAAAAILAARLRVPFSVTVRGDDINVFLKEFWRGPWIRWSLRRAKLVIALSNELKEIVSATGVPAERIVVIPNGVNADAFRPMDQKAARIRLGLPAEGRIVLAVARLHNSKGLPILVESVGRLVHQFPDVHVFIVGSPDHEADARPAILATAAQFGIQSQVHLVGAQDAGLLKYWYNAADVFCLPTAREGSANVLIEAIACGLPCITTPVGGNADIIRDHSLGTLTVANAESMSQAIAAAFECKWDRQQIATYGRNRTWHSVAEECRRHLMAIK